MTAYALPHYYSRDLMNAVCDWLRANNIDPKKIPLYSQVEVTDGQIRYYEQVTEPGHMAWEQRTAPLTTPMPDGLAAQWRVPPTLCPKCGADINATAEEPA